MGKDFESSIEKLSDLAPLRVWSLVVTIFGDAVAPRGDVAPATALQAILERLGVKPEAMRVALHRLVKDGWIDRQKLGRQSYYGLTAKGAAEIEPAQRRIYAEAPALKDPWRLVLTEDAPELIQITSGAFLGHHQSDVPEGGFVVSGTVDALPSWVSDALAPDPLPRDYAALEAVLKDVLACAPPIGADAAALRVLIIHQWRRLLLRHADLPAAFFPDGWRGEACRNLVLRMHAELSIQADPWLDEALTQAQRKAS